jgi:VWFA-related protein
MKAVFAAGKSRMLFSTEVAMFTPRRSVSIARCLPLAMLCFVVAVLAINPLAQVHAQSQPPSPQTQKPDQPTPDAGGPAGDTGVIAVPRKKDVPEEAPPPAPAAPKLKNPEELGNVSLRLEVPEVTVDVGVLLEKTHQFVPGLKPQNFRVYEDGIEQKVIGFKRVEAPITALMLCEFASNGAWWIKGNDMLNAAYSFTQQLRPQDYVALVTFDMHTQIITDFTQDKQQILQGLRMLQVPGFSETNVFDALYESLDRLDRIDGQKYIVLIATGRDTFSKLTFDKILARVKASHNITIFTVSTGGMLRAMTEGRGGMDSAMRDMDYLQADNEMKTFSSITGGMSFFPRFEGEMPDIFQNINQNIRSKYELVYRPTNAKQDGSYRKLRVALVDDEGQPLRFQDQKNKPLKYDIIARDGYRAKQEVE